jgi:hypothetical protein
MSALLSCAHKHTRVSSFDATTIMAPTRLAVVVIALLAAASAAAAAAAPQAQAATAPADKAALSALKRALVDDIDSSSQQQQTLASWDDATDPCSAGWLGVVCGACGAELAAAGVDCRAAQQPPVDDSSGARCVWSRW